jgi:putative holliday junction resolvase
MKLMGIDYGSKKVGIASTDESGRFALPRAIFSSDEKLADRVVEFAKENEINKVILGESRDFNNEPNTIMAKILLFKAELEKRGLEVVMHPEVLTTLEAAQLQGRGEMLDASAAALILKSYIDTLE